ncbi:MAG: ComF family protein [Oscillospiraceae bacterium]|nr:ComF family protein [Oscillospiraceae bacterium]
MNRAAKLILDLLFPPKCAFCRAVLKKDREDLGFCAGCEETLPRAPEARMDKRGEFFDFCLAPLYYRDAVRRSVLRFKFYGARAYCSAYAKIIAEAVKNETEAVFDAIAWAPVSKNRLRKRGYDQARLIAMCLSRELNVPCRPLLKKIRHTPPQSRIVGEEKRRANVSGAYAVCPGEDVRDLKIQLVDDVITTGSTLSECTRTLLMAGADRVICSVLARAE